MADTIQAGKYTYDKNHRMTVSLEEKNKKLSHQNLRSNIEGLKQLEKPKTVSMRFKNRKQIDIKNEVADVAPLQEKRSEETSGGYITEDVSKLEKYRPIVDEQKQIDKAEITQPNSINHNSEAGGKGNFNSGNDRVKAMKTQDFTKEAKPMMEKQLEKAEVEVIEIKKPAGRFRLVGKKPTGL